MQDRNNNNQSIEENQNSNENKIMEKIQMIEKEIVQRKNMNNGEVSENHDGNGGGGGGDCGETDVDFNYEIPKGRETNNNIMINFSSSNIGARIKWSYYYTINFDKIDDHRMEPNLPPHSGKWILKME
ncbi:32243_t:CDS:2 [Gigaspora margarita]|uniref:32243_t:CDS:1 n=1 Tax=Gigaspora margarita TaxID=4874 RepID=A0ABN7UYG0_GIGMA|nr:32243_t:CDS:2 [Gigaspora margarita]